MKEGNHIIETFKELSKGFDFSDKKFASSVINEVYDTITPYSFSRLNKRTDYKVTRDYYNHPENHKDVIKKIFNDNFNVNLTSEVNAIELHSAFLCSYTTAVQFNLFKKFNQLFDPKLRDVLLINLPDIDDKVDLTINEFIALKNVILPFNDKYHNIETTAQTKLFMKTLLTPEVILLTANYIMKNNYYSKLQHLTLISLISTLLTHEKITSDKINELIINDELESFASSLYSAPISLIKTPLIRFNLIVLKDKYNLDFTTEEKQKIRNWPNRQNYLFALISSKNIPSENIKFVLQHISDLSIDEIREKFN